MKKTNIYLGADHGGFELKNELKNYIVQNFPELKIFDLGTNSLSAIDYPDIAKKTCEKILENKDNIGLLFCGTGIGMSLSANRIKGIRAALVYNEFTAQMAKEHNNANVLILGGRTLNAELAKNLFKIWYLTEFDTDLRHTRRINKIDKE